MKSYGVTIQMKPLQQYFHMVLFILYVVLTFESVDKILWYYYSNEISLALCHLFCKILQKRNLNFLAIFFSWSPLIAKGEVSSYPHSFVQEVSYSLC